MVMPKAGMARAGLTRPAPGIGTKTKTPATRASVRRKPRRVAVETSRSPPIAAQVAENSGGVGTHSVEHPRQRNDKNAEEDQQGRGQPEGRHQGLANDLNSEFRGHA